jgi:hypothetical protein
MHKWVAKYNVYKFKLPLEVKRIRMREQPCKVPMMPTRIKTLRRKREIVISLNHQSRILKLSRY